MDKDEFVNNFRRLSTPAKVHKCWMFSEFVNCPKDLYNYFVTLVRLIGQ